MEYIYAAMLLHKAGKDINEDTLKSVLSSAGVKVDDGRVKATVSALKDVNIDESISKASIAQVAAPASAAPTAPAEAEAPAEESKAEAKKEEKKEASGEEAAAGLGALFG